MLYAKHHIIVVFIYYASNYSFHFISICVISMRYLLADPISE